MSQTLAHNPKSLRLANPTLVKLATPVSPLDGLLALLVTDVEGFTSLVETLGDAQAQLVMREHDQLLRASIRDGCGQEVAHVWHLHQYDRARMQPSRR